MNKLTIIDGNSLLFRAFYATSYNKIMTTSKGVPTNALFAFANMISTILKKAKKGESFIVVFDTGNKTFRHEKFSEYKAQRKPAPDELVIQFPLARQLLSALNIFTFELDGYEADDLAGTLARMGTEAKMDVNIYTSDKDYLQLVNENVTIQLIKKGLTNIDVVTNDNFKEMFEIYPENVIDYKGLCGDPSDNIPGIPGIGKKTSIKLINEYGSVENIIANADNLKGKLKEQITTFADQGILSKKLATIYVDVPLPFTLEDLVYEGYDFNKVSEFATTYELRTFLTRLTPKFMKVTEKSNEIHYETVTSFKDINIDDKIGIYTVFVSDKSTEIVGMMIHTDDENYYINLENLLKDKKLKDALSSNDIKKYTYDFKKQKVAFARHKLDLNGLEFDILLASYLLDASIINNPQAIFSYFNIALTTKEQNQLNLFDDNATEFLVDAEIAEFSLQKASEIVKQLKKMELEKVYYDIELPLTNVLSKMEIEGFPIDKDTLLSIGETFRSNLNEISNQIYALAGQEFNINSPQQVANILFDELKLPDYKKRSTAIGVLLNIIHLHPIVGLLIKYRKYSKLISTYIDGLVEYIYPDGKFHTIYNQAQTSTGRLSSSNPNLQNISVRDEEGKLVRKAFFYPDDNYLFLSLDYSQIELRILASLSNCTALINAFNNDVDIHRLTADALFKDENRDLARRKAKAVNFGIIYGISDYGLSEQLEVSFAEAHDIIKRFYETYPEIKTYREKLIKDVENNSYVETLTGRRRYLPEIDNQNYQVREFAKRAATNAPIQGTAADLIKISMIKIDDYLTKNNLNTKMVLQIHDELIFKVPVNEKDIVLEPLKNILENAMKFNVKLKVDGAFGKTWYDAS
jgi:DNA polymerase-1